MNGQLVRYCEENRLAAFVSGDINADTCLIFIPGLTDGLLALPYLPELDRRCREAAVALVQPILRSSYLGYGTATLAHDAADIAQLVAFLTSSPGSMKKSKFFLMGHSTGCQDILRFLRDAQPANALIRGCILQGPVSDREWLHYSNEAHDMENLIQKAHELGGGDELMPRATDPAPITARRFLSFASRGYPRINRPRMKYCRSIIFYVAAMTTCSRRIYRTRKFSRCSPSTDRWR